MSKSGKFTYAIDNAGSTLVVNWKEVSVTQSTTDYHYYSKIQMSVDFIVRYGTEVFTSAFTHALDLTVYNGDGTTVVYEAHQDHAIYTDDIAPSKPSQTSVWNSLFSYEFDLDRGRRDDATYIFPFSFSYKVTPWPATGSTLLNETFNDSIEITRVLLQEEEPYIFARSNGFTQVQNPSIGYKVPAPELIESLTLYMGFSEDKIVATRENLEIVAAKTITIELTEAEQKALIGGIPTATSGTIYFYLVSTSEGIEYWNYGMPATFRVYGGYPTWVSGANDVNDTNATTLAITGNSKIFIRYESDATFKLQATGNDGAWITNYTVSSNLQSASVNVASDNEAVTLTINDIDSWPCAITTTNSRGLTTGYTDFGADYLFIEYVQPTCSLETSVTAQGEITAIVSGAVFTDYFDALPGEEGNISNPVVVEYRYKLKSDPFFSDWTVIPFNTSDDDNYIFDNAYSLKAIIPGLDYKEAYVFEARVTDKLHTVESGSKQALAMTVFDWSKNDFNFNVPVNINGNIYQYNNLLALPNCGTWTPYCNACTSSGATRYGNYMLIGDMCLINFYFSGVIDVEPSETDWMLYFYGLPFTPHADYRWQAGGGNCQGYAVPAAGSVTAEPRTWTPPTSSKNGHRFTGWSIEGGVIYGRTQQSYDLAAESEDRATYEAVTGYTHAGSETLFNYQKPAGSWYITALPGQHLYASGTILYKIDPNQGGVVG